MMDKNGVNTIWAWAWAPQEKSEVEKNGTEREREREKQNHQNWLFLNLLLDWNFTVSIFRSFNCLLLHRKLLLL
jgi:hypothetical protein